MPLSHRIRWGRPVGQYALFLTCLLRAGIKQRDDTVSLSCLNLEFLLEQQFAGGCQEIYIQHTAGSTLQGGGICYKGFIPDVLFALLDALEAFEPSPLRAIVEVRLGMP